MIRPAALLAALGLASVSLAGGQTAIHRGPAIWFAPAPASLDLRELFLDGGRDDADDWSRARDGIRVFKFYAAQLLDRHEEAVPNTYDALRDVDAFRQLVDWRLETAIEVASVKGYSCETAAGVADLARQLIARVEAAGGAVHWLALDEPLLSGEYDCGLPETRTAALVADFIRLLRAYRPAIRIGLIEPYPTFTAARLQRFVERLDVEGTPPAFLHLDVDMHAVERLPADAPFALVEDLRALDAFSRARRMPFGYIVWGRSGASDRAYFESAAADGLATLREAFGTWDRLPSHVVFQSWTRDPAGRPAVPSNLPARGAYSHTYLIDFGLRCLQTGGPCRL